MTKQNAKAIISRVLMTGAPLIENDNALFVWRGNEPPLLKGDFSDWEAGQTVELQRLAPGIWTYRLPLPSDAYIEYAYFHGEERIADPLNRRRISNGMGKQNNYFTMPQHTSNPYLHQANRLQGDLSQHLVKAAQLVSGGERLVYLYQPPVEQPCPLLVVYDGRDYLRRAHLALMVERMIAANQMSPVAIAFLQNGGTARSLEYTTNDVTLGFIMEYVLPLAAQHLNLLDFTKLPGVHGILGASMGGLMALYTGLRLPQVFGHVLSQSGAFGFPEYDFVVFDLVEYCPRKELDIWMDVGLYDFKALISANRRMAELLLTQGYSLAYREYAGGHNYTSWRNDAWRGLAHLFPPGI